MLFKPSYPVRAKVRIGEKKQMGGGKERPASVDYFLCDDPEFLTIAGEKQQTIRVLFPYKDAEDNFSTGLEWWVKGRKGGNTLGCYTKDGETALRMSEMLLDDDVRVGEPIKSGRIPITCRFRECPIFKERKCKPMGRLIFWLDGGTKEEVYEIDTKSWNSIEALTAAFGVVGDPRGRVFNLGVSFHQKGRDRFPVLSLSEADVKVNSPEDVAKADALLALDACLSAEGLADREQALRLALAKTLDHTNPGWQQNEALVARIKEIGVEAAAKGLLERNL